MRIRTIKPEFWMHEGLASKSDFTRLLAIAILNWADDEGYFMANPILIRGQVFPFLDDSKIIPRSLQDLSSVGWIELGEDTQSRAIGRVLNFAKHQRVDKPKPSTIKPLWRFQDASKTNPRRIQDASKEEGKGREQGKEGNLEREREGGNARRRPTLAQAKSAAADIGITEDKAEEWWNCREASEWLKGMAGGATSPVGSNWQADLTTYAKRGGYGAANGKSHSQANLPKSTLADLMGGRKLNISKCDPNNNEPETPDDDPPTF